MPACVTARHALRGLAAFALLLATANCTSILGDFSQRSGDVDAGSPSSGSDATTSGDGSNNPGAALGTTCAAGTQCASGFCADGVCCNNACEGTCESCNQGGPKSGTCSPIGANTDPEMECVMIAPATDAGAGDAAVADAGDAGDAAPAEGGADAGAADGAVADGAVADGAAEGGPSLGYNQPEGGVSTDMTKCAGSCDGKGGNGGGSCVYPDSTKVCGTEFCNTTQQQAGFVCDGAGHCGLSLSDCADYSCSGTTGKCRTACSQVSDCLATDYCGADSICHPKKGNGIPCVTGPSECTSGYCDQGVCCNTDCSTGAGVPSPDCNAPMKAGTCTCSACATGPCAVYYRDSDSDGYGDPAVSTVACASGAAPTGYVTNSKDCDDGDANVNPAQTGYFATASAGKHTYDYNCDGSLEKGIPEYPGYNAGFCGFCGSPQSTTPACSVASYACTSSGEQSTLGCSEYFGIPIILATVSSKVTTQSAPIICGTCRYSYCGTSPTPDPYYQQYYPGSGFGATVDCGQSGTFIDCGTCSASTGSPSASSFSNKQTCH
jgi:hypothetical protein